MKKILFSTLMATSIFTAPLIATNDTQVINNEIKGVWQTEKKEDENRTAFVEIFNCINNPNLLCGKIIALEEPIDPETGKPKLDKENPDESLRSRPVMGIEMLKDFS